MSDQRQDEDSAPTARPPDGYEAGFMQSTGQILFREKSVAPRTWQLMFLLPALATLVVFLVMLAGGASLAAALPGILIGLGATFVMGLAWLMFVVLRVTVSTDDVYVQFGPFGPRIPVSSIESVEAIDYKWTEFGGWGIKRSFKDGTTIYNMWGDHGRAVKVAYRDKDGKLQRVAVGTARAPELASAIRQAMESKRGTAVRARVESGPAEARLRAEPGADAAAEPLAEQDADTETDESRAKRSGE